MGANYIDYIIADSILIPAPQQINYSEKIVYLPNSYQANDAKRAIADRVFTRAELRLPQNDFVFCCFNNNYKISPEVFDCCMQILKHVEGSVLWLLEPNASAISNLRNEANARGVDGERLVEATRSALAADAALLAPEHRAPIDRALAALEKALAGSDHRAIKQAVETLNRATEPFAERRMDEGIRRALAGKKIGSL